MNISFVFGVLFTLATEFITMVVLGIYLAVGDKKKGGEPDAEESNPVPTATYDSGGKWNNGTC